MNLCKRFFLSSKHLFNSISGIVFKAFFDSACINRFETVLNDPLEMPIVSARSLIVNRGFLCTNSLIWLTCVARQLMLMAVQGVPSHQHVLCLLWSLCTTYKHFFVTWSNHRRLSATFWTFPQLKFHSVNKI